MGRRPPPLKKPFVHNDFAALILSDMVGKVARMFDPRTGGETPGEQLDWVLAQRPSADTHAVLESLSQLRLSPDDAVSLAQAWDRQLSAMTVASMAAKVVATAPRGGLDGDLLEAELALALRRTDGEVAYELSLARRVLSLPVMAELLRDGAVSVRHATSLADLVAPLDAVDAAEVDAEVSHRAASMTVAGFRRVVRKCVARLDRRTPEQRARARRPRIGVKVYPQDDGLVTLAATMPAEQGIAALSALNARADVLRAADDPRLAGERQIDALLDALCGASGGSRPARVTKEVQVVIDHRALLGLVNAPGELRGYGPIAADDVRRMLLHDDCVLRRLVTDPVTGTLVDYACRRYAPDDFLRRLIAARDVTCRYPGCTANAVWCDDEHCLAYDDGGPTSAGNCCLMCRRHHRRKTFDGFTYTRPDAETGETQWTTPLGRTYTQCAASYDHAGCDPGDTISDPDPPV